MSMICPQQVRPSDQRLQYMGRIDDSCADAPVFVYPCTNVRIRFRGTAIGFEITNLHG